LNFEHQTLDSETKKMLKQIGGVAVRNYSAWVNSFDKAGITDRTKQNNIITEKIKDLYVAHKAKDTLKRIMRVLMLIYKLRRLVAVYFTTTYDH
jgi:hypothetical protein